MAQALFVGPAGQADPGMVPDISDSPFCWHFEDLQRNCPHIRAQKHIPAIAIERKGSDPGLSHSQYANTRHKFWPAAGTACIR